METNQIKKFAIEARNILKTGVLNKITSLGFDTHGKVEEKNKPLKVQPGAIFMGTHIADDTFYDKWISLYERVQQKGVKEICEEAAYTWFNRLMAIRIMQKNGFISPILAYESEIVHIPHIVAEARRGILPTMTENNRRALLEYMEDDNKVTEQFTYLIIAFCQFNPVLKACFGSVNDYTELLLPKNILAEGGFIDLLNHTDFISDEDYCSPELIGWLYQFYISEKKDEVFASFKKSKKAEAEDIPAATQIFTPNWIVKYMVQNTIGRIYLDNNPYSSLAEQMKYLVEPSEPTPQEAKLVISDIETMKMIDPACGSGHILIEAFDLFYQMYQEEGYSRRQAVEAILTKNLLGIDLDTRAKQLAMFALLMAACKKDTYFLEANILPQVLDMSGIPALYDRMKNDLSDILLTKDNKILNELMDAMKLLQQADNLGSIMKFDISEVTREIIVRRLTEYKVMSKIESCTKAFIPALKLILALTDKYTVVVANPPYMGRKNMNENLKKYLELNYSKSKADLYSVFLEMILNNLLSPMGLLSMITMRSWMFRPAFKDIRLDILHNKHIINLIDIGVGLFDEMNGEVLQTCAYTIKNHFSITNFGVYINCTVEKESKEKELLFLTSSKKIYILQSKFDYIDSSPISYWATEKDINHFKKNHLIQSYGDAKQGLATGNNNKFMRFWHEVEIPNIAFLCTSTDDAIKSGCKWFPYNKGGEWRKWYGNQDYIVDWDNDGYAIKHNFDNKQKLRSRPQNLNFFFKKSISWSLIVSNNATFRYFPEGFIFDVNGMSLFVNNNEEYYLAFLNSKVGARFLKILNPTLAFQCGDVAACPYIEIEEKEIKYLVQQNIEISKIDWDSHETSWDFKENELIPIHKQDPNYIDSIAKTLNNDPFDISLPNTLQNEYNKYVSNRYKLFTTLHHNEEELNRQFIEIYGLQDELTPDVPLKEITILQQGEITIKDNEITFNADVIMKQFISYAVGCWMGRYRLDRPGLQIAHPNPAEEETAPYSYNGEEFTIDDDAIIPFMSRDCAFDDNAVSRFTDFVRITFGAETLTENLNFIEESLGKTLEDYLVKDFWKDHP